MKAVGLLVWFFWATLPISAQLTVPDPVDNPYELIYRERLAIKADPNKDPWYVYANRNHAPLYATRPRGGTPSVLSFMNFLEKFEVLEQRDAYIHVRSQERLGVEGWADMNHFLLQLQAIKNPKNHLDLKAFGRVVIKGDQTKYIEKGKSRLRFRDGPGKGSDQPSGNNYVFLSGEDEYIKTGDLFFYVYGVFFKNADGDSYKDVNRFRDADYFLVGTARGLSPQDVKSRKNGKNEFIKGWLPSDGAVLWLTRQALDKKAGIQPPEAHIFDTDPRAKKYFDSPRPQREQLLREEGTHMVVDQGEIPKENGQRLRHLLLEQIYSSAALDLLQIGFSGQDRDQAGPDIWTDIQKTGLKANLCFLIDATRSMADSFEGAVELSESILQQLADKKIQADIHAAVFRDQLDGLQSFGQKPQHLSAIQWLRQVREASAPGDPDYEEALYEGIKRTLEGWPFSGGALSPRVLVIIGDTGDNGRGADFGEVEELLRRYSVMPLVLQMEHPFTNSNDLFQQEREQQAMDGFIPPMDRLARNIYGDVYDVDPRFRPGKVSHRQVAQGLKDLVKPKVELLAEFFSPNTLSDLRFGLKSAKDKICEIAYPNDPVLQEQCKKSQSRQVLVDFLSQNQKVANNPGLIMAYLDNLKNQDVDAWQMVMETPEIAFQNGYIALRHQNTTYFDTVYLFATGELAVLKGDYDFLISNRQNRDKEAKIHDVMVTALKLIVGEVFTTHTDQVTLERMKDWLDLMLQQDTPLFGNAGRVDLAEVARAITAGDSNWSAFLGEIKKNADYIKNLLNDAQGQWRSRHYIDAMGVDYFWVYPDEIFPGMQKVSHGN